MQPLRGNANTSLLIGAMVFCVVMIALTGMEFPIHVQVVLCLLNSVSTLIAGILYRKYLIKKMSEMDIMVSVLVATMLMLLVAMAVYAVFGVMKSSTIHIIIQLAGMTLLFNIGAAFVMLQRAEDNSSV